MELTVHKETVVVEEIKEVELRSRNVQFIYDGNDDRGRLQRRGPALSRLPVKKLRKKKCANSRLKRYKGKNVSLFQRGSNKRVPKRGKVYLLSKYERREVQ